jgi:uncharacterized protein with LGFP repeats
MVDWIASFLNEYHNLTSRWATIYSTTDWWTTCTGNTSNFAANDPLWIARYASDPGPLPAGWASYTFWQFADQGTYPGDQDTFNGSHDQLVSVANNGPTNCMPFTSPGTGTHSVCGAILAKYEALGGPASFLGYPTTDETATPDGIGRYNHFSSTASSNNVDGSIYWTPSTGAWSIHGGIRAKWASLGWERSCLGYPVSDEFGINGGRQNNFQRGTITWSFATGQATSSC